MQAVNVIVNLNTSQLNHCFTYAVPREMNETAEFGKRVLVDFRGKKTEAFIIDRLEADPDLAVKPILKVLDEEAVFNHELLELAQWMADYYSVSLAMILSMIIPRQLQRKTSWRVTPAVSQEAFAAACPDRGELTDFMELLWSKGELNLTAATRMIGRKPLQEMIDQGLLSLNGSYRQIRVRRNDKIYILDLLQYEQNRAALSKKAPRQSQALEILAANPSLSCAEFDKLVPRSITAALIKKGLVSLGKISPEIVSPDFQLNEEQVDAINRITGSINGNRYEEYLLFGITGSGKTEVYVRTALATIDQGKTVIVLVPEIALTRQLVEIFSRRIEDIAVLHSAMSAGERYEEWKRIKRGEAKLVLGPRSAVFAPLPRLGLVIMDEEQEYSYKQEETPRYHTRDIARERACRSGAVLLLGSATPALETFYRVTTGQAQLLRLTSRTAGASVPRVIIEDMRKSFKSGNRGVISPYLRESLNRVLKMEQQSILFINRRGHSPMTICRECGNIASCPNCSVGMTYHRDLNQNVCHYCNIHLPQPSVCGICGSRHLQMAGTGTQKVEDEIRGLFPQARIARLDLDSSRRQGAQKEILQAMGERRIDILIGTQMVAKGFDFPLVSLVGVIDADSLLNLPDYRARERSFQLLVQVAGRAGRSDITGEVIIQTYNPQEPLFEKVVSQDYERFYRDEIKIRSALEYPPFNEVLRIVVNSDTESSCRDYAIELAKFIEEVIDAKEDSIMILGPAPCPISKIKNRYRHQIIIKCLNSLLLRSIAAKINNRINPSDIKLELDLNPMVTF